MFDRLDRLMARVGMVGVLAQDVPAFLHAHNRQDLARHVARVAGNAVVIAGWVGVDVGLAEAVGWLHDISQVMSSAEMLAAAAELGLAILPEERQVPYLLHGAISAVMASRYFGVDDVAALDAMRCHSTLRAGATPFDKVLFAADKLAWDPGDAPYVVEMQAAMECSLDDGVRCFLRWAWAGRERQAVVHPWLEAAYREMCL